MEELPGKIYSSIRDQDIEYFGRYPVGLSQRIMSLYSCSSYIELVANPIAYYPTCSSSTLSEKDGLSVVPDFLVRNALFKQYSQPPSNASKSVHPHDVVRAGLPHSYSSAADER